MEIKCLTVGELQVNCYILKNGSEAIVIDPGDECDLILKNTGDCNISKILLTHGHFDHIGAVAELKEKTDAKLYVHSEDREMLCDDTKNLSDMTGVHITPSAPDFLLDDISEIAFGKEKIKVHYTPGHSGGGVCFEVRENLFSGDLLFQGSIGRFDRGDLRAELNSLKYLMDNFDDEVKVYPGHGPATTIGFERRCNPYIVNHIG